MQEVLLKNKKKLMKTLGQIICKYRKAKNLSIYRISAEIGMSKSTWREAELGLCGDINLSTLWMISEGLELPLDKLIQEISQKLGKDFTLTDFD